MDNLDELIERLRVNSRWRNELFQCVTDPALLAEAADALTALKAERDALEHAGREVADKLWILRCNSRDDLDRKAAERACDMWDAALRSGEHMKDCPSCHGLNISCPDGCGRDPETGELNGTRYEHMKGEG